VRILWLNAGLLLPLDKGGKLRTWHLMRHLASRHEITYLSFANAEETNAYRQEMSAVCSRLVTVPRREDAKGTLRFYAGVAQHLLDPAPFAVGRYRAAAYRRALDALLETRRFDRVVCDFLVPAVNVRRSFPCPSILFTHNVEAEIWRRHADTASGALRRALYRQQWSRMRRFEARTLGRFDRVLAVSEADRDTFARLYPNAAAPVSIIPTGVDTAYFQPPATSAVTRPHIVFVGSMDWLPNEDGVVYFCRHILPQIAHDVPDVTLSIVGRSPTAAVRRLADDPRVQVTGRVDDVRPALHEAAVAVVPLRIGGGTRLKIFEAMAAGTPVVSTTIGAEGLPAVPGRHLLVADDPDGFARAVVTLLRSPEARRQMADAARSLVVEQFDWQAVSGHLDEAITGTSFLSGTPGAVRRAEEHPLKAS
jgi:sugar transferase (PEP-CTERM/EpsH1 system associated)